MTLEEIETRDPAFDRTTFLARAEAVLSVVQRARAEGRPALARTGVSDEMAARISAELEQQRAAGQRQVIDVRIRSSALQEANAGPQRDSICVRFQLEGVSYLEKDGKPIAGHSDKRRPWAEDWWFQRRAGTTTAAATSVDLGHCGSCGAPSAGDDDGVCDYCGGPLASQDAWVVSRITDAQAGTSVFDLLQVANIGSAYVVPDMAAATRTAKRASGVVSLVVLLIVGATAFGIYYAVRQGGNALSDAVESATGGATLPAGVSLPPGVTLPPGMANPKATATTGYLTPVVNPKVRAPVNDLAAAAAAVRSASGGRPVTDVHLYEDGRILFSVQAPDDPASTDSYTWKAGQVGQPSQGPGSVRPERFFSLEGVDLSRLVQVCNDALGKVGIADGVIKHPYLVSLGKGDVRWYVPVESEARASNQKTYRVSLDGKKSDVF